MSQLLSASEILGFAVHIEQNGYEFYTEVAKKFNDAKVMEFFHLMAEEELNHERTFKGLQENVGKFTPPESYPGEYEEYMKQFLKSIAPKTNESMKARVEKTETLDDVFDTALLLEQSSIVFYTTLKSFVAPEKEKILEQIIQEEVRHILKIQSFRAGNVPPAPDVDSL